MSNCPRCGATNKPGRPACWNCWAALPQEASPQASSEVLDAPAPPRQREGGRFYFPSRPERPEDPAPPPVDPVADDPAPPSWGEVAAAAEAPLPVARPVVAASDRGARWLIVLAAVLLLLLLAAMLAWRFTFAPRVGMVGVARVAQSYLTALTMGDTTTRTRLATEATKREQFPGWMAVGQAGVLDTTAVEGRAAHFTVRVLLQFTNPEARKDPLLRAALSRDYRLTLTLNQERDGWHVDQHDFLDQLRGQILQENPGVKLPPWE